MAATVRENRFDACLILSQIILLQFAFYASMYAVLFALDTAFAVDARISQQIFNHTYVTFSNLPGCVTCVAIVTVMAVPSALAFTLLVTKGKRSVDFATTLFVTQTAATTFHSGFPNSPVWWLVNITATIAMAVVADCVSVRIEFAKFMRSYSQLVLPTHIQDRKGGAEDGLQSPNARFIE